MSFKASEMNDVLKSLTVLDLGTPAGTISCISYEAPSSSAVVGGAQYEAGHFDVANVLSLTDLLARLKGVRVCCSLKNGNGNLSFYPDISDSLFLSSLFIVVIVVIVTCDLLCACFCFMMFVDVNCGE